MNNNLYTSIALVIVGAIAIGAYFFPSFVAPVQTAGSPTAGASFNNAKIAAINMALATVGQDATTSSILNTDANDRIITDGFVYCAGIGNSFGGGGASGIANWNVKAATSSTAAPADISALANFNLNIPVGTSTPINYISTTTDPVLGDAGRVWASGAYETFFWNATNTAACQPGVHFLST